jgi:peptidoglycan/xylan/chitin deacetylase (PgdA/CDA1 family)
MVLFFSPRQWVKQACVRSGALRLAGRLSPPGAVILMYHSVQDRPERYADSIGVPNIHATTVFERQMELLARQFHAVTLEDVLLFLKGEKTLPRRAVAITFDDGYADNFHIAAPVMDRFGIRGAFYATVSLIGTRKAPWFSRLRHAFGATRKDEWLNPGDGSTGKLTNPEDRENGLRVAFGLCAPMPDAACEQTVSAIERDLEVEPLALRDPLMMNWEEIRSLARAGHIVGSHTLTHPNVARIPADEVRKELVESRLRLEEQLGSPVHHFSYPGAALNPVWTVQTLAISREAGYQTAVVTDAGPVRAGHEPLALTRCGTPRSEDEFLWKLERTFLGRSS